MTWEAAEFDGFRHGYAGTIYKGQGRTLDHTYLLHTHHWRAAASYVALTRQREGVQVFVSTEVARAAARQATAAPARRGERDRARACWDGVAAAATTPVGAETAQGQTVQPVAARTGAEQGTTAAGWLIAPYLDPSGQERDSLRPWRQPRRGRGRGGGRQGGAA